MMAIKCEDFLTVLRSNNQMAVASGNGTMSGLAVDSSVISQFRKGDYFIFFALNVFHMRGFKGLHVIEFRHC